MADTPTTAAEMPALKRCPFCGGEATRVTITDEDEVANIGGDVIYCRGCEACTRVFFGEKEGIVEAWNRRPLPSDGPVAVPGERIDCTAEQLHAMGQAYASAYADALAERAASDDEMVRVAGELLRKINYAKAEIEEYMEDDTGLAPLESALEALAEARALLSRMEGKR